MTTRYLAYWLALALSACPLDLDARADVAERIDTIHAQGNIVGHVRTQHHSTLHGYRWRESTRFKVRVLRRFELAQAQVEVARDRRGRARNLRYRETIQGTRTEVHAILRDDMLFLRGGGRRAAGPPIRLPAGTLLPDQIEFALRARRHEQAAWRPWVLDLSRMRAVRATVHAERAPGAPDHRVVYLSWNGRQGAQQRAYEFGPDGALVDTKRMLFGTTTNWTPCTRACPPPLYAGIEFIQQWVVASPYRIPRKSWQRRLRYVIERRDGEPVQIAATSDQHVAVQGGRAVVTVCAGCAQEPAPSAATLRRYMRSNLWVQSEHPLLRRAAAKAGSRSMDADRRMRILIDLVRARLSGPASYARYGDALSAWRDRSGDCTEYALLLAALARAQGIPARIVAGMAYADRFSGKKDVFSPHVWVQAWLGDRWRSYDAALESFDSTHIALAVGDGDPRAIESGFAQLALLHIKAMGAVRPSATQVDHY
jgi:hypothetical protein